MDDEFDGKASNWWLIFSFSLPLAPKSNGGISWAVNWANALQGQRHCLLFPSDPSSKFILMEMDYFLLACFALNRICGWGRGDWHNWIFVIIGRIPFLFSTNSQHFQISWGQCGHISNNDNLILILEGILLKIVSSFIIQQEIWRFGAIHRKKVAYFPSMIVGQWTANPFRWMILLIFQLLLINIFTWNLVHKSMHCSQLNPLVLSNMTALAAADCGCICHFAPSSNIRKEIIIGIIKLTKSAFSLTPCIPSHWRRCRPITDWIGRRLAIVIVVAPIYYCLIRGEKGNPNLI